MAEPLTCTVHECTCQLKKIQYTAVSRVSAHKHTCTLQFWPAWALTRDIISIRLYRSHPWNEVQYMGTYLGVGACLVHCLWHRGSPSLAISILVTKLTTTLLSPPAPLVSMATPSGPEGGVADGGTCTVLRTPSMETVSVVRVCNKRVLAHKLGRNTQVHVHVHAYTWHVHVHMYMELLCYCTCSVLGKCPFQGVSIAI